MSKWPNKRFLKTLQEYSHRGWVYRPEEGWVFAELTPDELAEFKSYGSDITISRMKVRLPHGEAGMFLREEPDFLVNWFAHCTVPHVRPLAQKDFQIQQVTNNEDRPTKYWTWFPIELGSYETWLWADEIKICRELGYEVIIHRGFGWMEWGVPSEWGPPVTTPSRPRYREHVYIYFLEDDFSHEIGYVGQSTKPERRLIEHLKDTKNPDKVAWIQSRLAQGHTIKSIVLEKIPGVEANKRERYWVAYYWSQGHNLTNRVCRYWK